MRLLGILFAHCLGDYVLQSQYIANNKGKDAYLLLVHSILYTFAVSLIFGPMIEPAMYYLILLSHFGIDMLKAYGITPGIFGDSKALIIDQVLHYLVLMPIIFI